MSQPEPKLGSEPGFTFVWACLMGLPGVSQHKGLRRHVKNNIQRQWVWGDTSQVSESPGKFKKCVPSVQNASPHSHCVCVHACVQTSKKHCFGTKIGLQLQISLYQGHGRLQRTQGGLYL